MRYLTKGTENVARLVHLNSDRVLPPVLIVAALALSAWILSLGIPY